MNGGKMDKRYGLPTAICMVIGIVIGSGVFIKGGKVLSLTGGDMGQAVLVVGIVGVICIVCSLVFAQLGSRYEKVNGFVDYAEAALGPRYAYYVGWFATTIYYPTLATILAFFAAMFTLALFGVPSLDFAAGTVSAEAVGLGAAYLMLGYGINAISPKLAGRMQVSMTVVKLIPLVLMAVVGTVAGLTNGATALVLHAQTTPVPGGLFVGVVAFAFAYEGWITATSINAELKNARRNLPLALIVGALFCTALYCLYIFSMSAVGDVDTIIGTWPLGERLPGIAFSKVFGNAAGTLVYVFVAVSCLGTMNGLIMGSCRGMYSVAVRGMGPRPEFYGDLDRQNNFSVKSSLAGLMISGFWYAWTVIMWMKGPDFMGGIHNSPWLGWEPDEISIVTLYAIYIPMFLSLMVRGRDFGPVRRYVLPGAGVLCCLFMVYSCFVGKGFQQVGGYLIFFAAVMFAGWALDRRRRKRAPAAGK